MPTSPAYILARLDAGLPVDPAAIETLPAHPFRELARAAQAANGEGRHAAILAALAGKPYRDEILKALLAVDPHRLETEQAEAPDMGEPPEAPPFDSVEGVPLLTASPQAEGRSIYASQLRGLPDAFKPRDTLPYIVRAILPSRSVVCVYGPPGTLKTNLLIDLGFCVALGRDWLMGLPDKGGYGGYPVAQTTVLWVDVDNGEDVMAERMRAFARAYNASPEDTPFRYITFPNPPLVAAKGLKHLAQLAIECKAGLIVIDNLLNIAGVRDENSSEMGEVMKAIRLLAEMTGATVVIIHHTPKENASEVIRGHSSIEAGLDSSFLIKRAEGEDTITIKHKKVRRKPLKPFGAMWTYEAEADGETLRAARFYGTQPPDIKTQTEEETKDKIKAALVDGPMPKTKLREAVRGYSATFEAMLTQLLEAGEVTLNEQKVNGQKAKMISLTAPALLP